MRIAARVVLALVLWSGVAAAGDPAEAIAAYDRVRADPVLARSPAAIDDLLRRAGDLPAGAARVDVWILVAGAYERMGRLDDAAGLWLEIASDAHADPVAARSASSSLVTLWLSRGDFDRAGEAAGADAALRAHVGRMRRRHYLHFTSIAALAALFGLGALAIARSRRVGAVLHRTRGSGKLALAYAVYVAGGGALLASGYEAGSAAPFLVYGVALVPVLVVARAWAAAGASSTPARAGRAALSAAGALGAAFLVLEQGDGHWLDGLGL